MSCRHAEGRLHAPASWPVPPVDTRSRSAKLPSSARALAPDPPFSPSLTSGTMNPMPALRHSVLFLVLARSVCLASEPVSEDLDAPPVVTATAWAVADADDGRLLWSLRPDEPRKAASTTKMMCALAVLELAAADPAVLDEWVVVSKLADGTAGSTADLHEGEKVRVRDGLYALMLPSGNDMGNAFAEHFHPRLPPPGDETPAEATTAASATRMNFVAEMNRGARRLGMDGTTYRIAYGDGGGSDARTTTARDLVALAFAARKHPLFREVVSSASHAATILRPDGTERQAEWENTNELLRLANYDGVKTGTTPAAGHCLVATGTHGGRSLIVVTLGSSSAAARFADSRNLFRWAWRELRRTNGAPSAGPEA